MMRKVGLYLPTSGMGPGLMRGIAEFSHEQGDWWIMLRGGLHPGALAHLPESNLSGIIAMVSSPGLAQGLKDTGIAVVNVSSSVDLPELPSVVCNHALVSELAAEHFCQLGLKHFAVGASPGHAAIHRRGELFQRIMVERGYTCPMLPPAFGLCWEKRAEEKQHEALLRELPKPVGILATTDYQAMAILEMARSLNLRVPQDVAVIGVDNSAEITQLSKPTLTSIDINAKGIGYEAAKLLHELMAGLRPPAQPILIDPARLVRRGSTNVVAVDTMELTDTVEFIDPDQDQYAA